jgi:predicted N-acetyltransferase YhbS
MIRYATGNGFEPELLAELLRACSLGARRPVDEPERVAAMLRNANLTVTAWEGDRLVGVARSLSDFGHVTYVADLAVRASHQRRGIGLELLRRTRAMSGRTMLVLLAAPEAADYYPRIGFRPHGSAWMLREGDAL